MSYCNIQRTDKGINVFVEGTQTPSKLYSNLVNIVESEPDFVSARPTWLANLYDKVTTAQETAVEIYKFITRNEAVKTFMAGSSNIDSNGEPLLTLHEGGYVVTNSDNRQKLVIPARETESITTESAHEKVVRPSKRVKKIVDSLSKRFGIRVKYTTIGDFKGRFVVEGDDRYVELNLAKMTDDTPFHEFSHPLILALHKSNPIIYDKLIAQYGSEEAIVEALGKESLYTYSARQLTHYLRSILARVFPSLQFNPNLESLTIKSTLRDLADIVSFANKVEIPFDLGGDMTLYQRDTEEVKNILNSQKVNDTDYISLLGNLSSKLEEKDTDEEHYYLDNAPIKRLTQWVSSTFSKAQLTPEQRADAIFKRQNKDIATDKIYLENGKLHYTYEEAIVYFKAIRLLIAERGRLKHSYIELLMEKDVTKAKRLEEDIWKRAKA